MRHKYFSIYSVTLLFVLCFFYSCSKGESHPVDTEDEQTEEARIRIMTYNIHHANPPGSDVIDLDAIADVISESDADLIALQELDSVTVRSGKVFQLEYLAQKLNMEYHFFGAIPYQDGSYGVGVLSKYPISNPKKIMLPKMSDISSEDRVLGMVRVSLPDDNDIYFASTHWDVVSEENRRLQAEKTNQEALMLDAPFILGGDLNTRPESESMNILTSVFTAASEKNNPTIPVNNPNRKIDHILYVNHNDFSLLDEEVIFNNQTRKVSDHLPFVVDLQMN